MSDPQAATGDVPGLAELEAMDPFDCIRVITSIAKDRGNLSPELAALRVTRLLEARDRDGRKVSWLAKRVGLAASGISRLTSSKHPVRARLSTEGATS